MRERKNDGTREKEKARKMRKCEGARVIKNNNDDDERTRYVVFFRSSLTVETRHV